MFRKITLGLLIAIALMVSFVTVTIAQRTPTLAALQPFIFDFQQTVPFSLTLTLPNTNVTVTVPSELDIALSIQVRADGIVSPTVKIAKATPVVDLTTSESLEDDLGNSYTTEIEPPGLSLIEWTTYLDSQNVFSISGEVFLAPDAESVGNLRAIVRFYNASGKLIEVEDIDIVARALDPGEHNRFEDKVDIESDAIDHYTVSIRSMQ